MKATSSPSCAFNAEPPLKSRKWNTTTTSVYLSSAPTFTFRSSADRFCSASLGEALEGQTVFPIQAATNWVETGGAEVFVGEKRESYVLLLQVNKFDCIKLILSEIPPAAIRVKHFQFQQLQFPASFRQSRRSRAIQIGFGEESSRLAHKIAPPPPPGMEDNIELFFALPLQTARTLFACFSRAQI